MISKWVVIFTQDQTVGSLGAVCTDGSFLGQMAPIFDAASPLQEYFDKTCNMIWSEVQQVLSPADGNFSYRQDTPLLTRLA